MAEAFMDYVISWQQTVWRWNPGPRHFIQWDKRSNQFFLDNSMKTICIQLGYQFFIYTYALSGFTYFLGGAFKGTSVDKIRNWVAISFQFAMFTFCAILAYWHFRKRNEIVLMCNQLSQLYNAWKPMAKVRGLIKSKATKKFALEEKFGEHPVLSGIYNFMYGTSERQEYFLSFVVLVLILHFCVAPPLITISYMYLFNHRNFQIDPTYFFALSFHCDYSQTCGGLFETLKIQLPIAVITYLSVFDGVGRMLSLTIIVYFKIILYITMYLKGIRKTGHTNFPEAINMYRSLILLMRIGKSCMAQLLVIALSGMYLLVMLTTAVVVMGGIRIIPLSIFSVIVLVMMLTTLVVAITLSLSTYHYEYSTSLLNEWKRWNPTQHSRYARRLRKEAASLKPISFHFGSFRRIDSEAKVVYWESLMERTIDTCLLFDQWN